MALGRCSRASVAELQHALTRFLRRLPRLRSPSRRGIVQLFWAQISLDLLCLGDRIRQTDHAVLAGDVRLLHDETATDGEVRLLVRRSIGECRGKPDAIGMNGSRSSMW